jgi:redox-sensitive bicupin YhaK (pirin superfamily)
MHPHRDMEIITHILSGQLWGLDRRGRVITPGEFQYSAGDGVRTASRIPARTVHLQIWIVPDEKGSSRPTPRSR